MLYHKYLLSGKVCTTQYLTTLATLIGYTKDVTIHIYGKVAQSPVNIIVKCKAVKLNTGLK